MGGGQTEEECAALSHLALHPDLAAVRLDDVLGNEQAEPQPSTVVAAALREALEDRGQLVGGNPLTAVGHREPDVIAMRFDPQRNSAALGGEFQSIAEEVRQHLKN